MRGKDDRIGEKTSKDRWEKIDVISLLQLLGVNNCQPLLHMSKIQVYLYTTYKRVKNISIGYMINPTLHINKVFREQVEIFLRSTIHQNTMESIINGMINKDAYVISLLMFYESKTKNRIKVYRVLSCVLYSVIVNHV